MDLCKDGKDRSNNYPELKANPGPLTARVKHPNKEEAVTSFISHFGKHVELVGRPEGCEGVVVPAKLPKKSKKSKKGKGHKKSKDKAKKDKSHKRKSKKRTRVSEKGECSSTRKYSKTQEMELQNQTLVSYGIKCIFLFA